VTSYLFRTTHVICLDPVQRPDLRDVTDWLERAVRLEGAEVKRGGERSLDFRPSVGALVSFRPSWEPTLALVSRGEIEVDSTDAGPRITVYLQPRSWLALIPLIQISLVFGVAGANGVLRWGAGLGGLLLVGLIFGWAWVNAQDIFGRIAEEIRLSHAKIPPRRNGAA